MKRFILLPASMLILILSMPICAQAAMLTDVLDAADVNEDPFDFSISVDFRQELEWATITRERNTLSSAEKAMLNQNEFNYKAVRNLLFINARFGLYHDLEFHFTLPVHIEEKYTGKMSGHWGDKFWGGEYSPNTLHQLGRPSLLTDRVFGFAAWESTHRGFGDLSFGFTYSPVNQTRDPDYPSWILTFDIQVPSGSEQNPKMEPAAANLQKGIGNSISVGKKLVGLIFKTAISKRIGAAEPYFGLDYKVNVATSGYIQDARHQGGFLLGNEAVIYELQREGENEPLWKVVFDFRMSGTIVGRGQDFNAITDALAWRRDMTNTTNTIYWPTDPRLRVTENPHMFYYYEGGKAPEYQLPIEDRYVNITGLVGIQAILYHYLLLKAEFTFGYNTDHYLSLPEKLDYNTLRPLDKGGYNTQINEVGARVRYSQSFVFGYTFTLGFSY